ncbi:indole-3-glycerol phosphate synthase TrpC [Viridibacillus sp. FSL R5-0477]|uniref:Indole-3-glycerol phosphate synthase n=1 Tax=Viridibacillus arenosi FSL R5-213 TaxID=1227360 RepID=W4F1X8_9BACL|nr:MULTISPECIES: indole-3-glycerol phosphate synthase TrpC [Viridibacillus]ETT86327.1 indole-3-glycerol phosphate synthase [Viridibacillus arenosi FSL R5-213]OMC85878.1 indole-3-glycerol phosphate synthase [Viridibacillus sp. FSL H7-0596]OMC91826.1 indole-3-glycerol phosphate synthase [Viridibacillus arenosi]
MTILDRILKEKENEVLKLLQNPPEKIKGSTKRPSLFDALYQKKRLQIIAEMKRASPSKGLINEGANPVEQARIYEQAGAACISVLTDTPFFKGSFEDLKEVSNAVGIPLLCKDFIIHEVQIDQAKASGASVILLIVAALQLERLQTLYEYAIKSKLEILVEVHNTDELQQALKLDARLIGVNNRDLKTFDVDLARTAEIADIFPFHEKRVLISESGMQSSQDAEIIAKHGASAILVGETLMRSGEVAQTIETFKVEKGVEIQ